MVSSPSAPLNLFTVDLEEWFVVQALEGRFAAASWAGLPSTLIRNTRRLLETLNRHQVQATWFVLGWCAAEHPEVIEEIASAGHEIACHSYLHRRVDGMRPDEFRSDTLRSMQAIMAATGIRPRGYRAPSWSITGDIPWAFDILAELGFDYDSSIFPIKHDLYGMPQGPRDVFRMKCRGGRFLYEIPASTYRLAGKNIPAVGGGYLRHTPYWYTRAVIRHLNKKRRPAVVYLHPWEIDPDPPRVAGLSAVQRLRSYGSTSLLQMKLERLLAEFSFTTASQYLQATRRQRIGFE